MARLLAVLVVLWLSGCAGAQRPLDERWRPLEVLEETNDPDQASDFVRTSGGTVYVKNFQSFFEQIPLNSPWFDALMTHERIHAVEQRKHFFWRLGWNIHYALSSEFRLEQEKLGYEAQLLFLKAAGVQVQPERFASYLVDPFYGGMLSYEEALAWVKGVLSRWP